MDADPAIRAALPPTSGILGRRAQATGRLLDLVLEARQRVLGLGRLIDREAEESPVRDVLIAGIYGVDGADTMHAAIERLRSTRHRVRFALGALGPAVPALEAETVRENMRGGKFANFNRLIEASQPLASDWIVLLDDDIQLPRRFLDRAIHIAEALRFDLAQPALSRASHTAWEPVRRHPALARQTGGIEIGPLTLMSHEVLRSIHPLPESGMGWGLDLHWAALARERGWRLGVLDATPVRHEMRRPATGYEHAVALEAALRFLESHVYVPYSEAVRSVAVHQRLPR